MQCQDNMFVFVTISWCEIFDRITLESKTNIGEDQFEDVWMRNISREPAINLLG